MAYYFQGTVHPAGKDINPEKEAEKLFKAMRGLGTDEKVIIQVLTSCCNEERQTIKKMYKTMYGQDLVDDLRDDLSGNFETLCLYLLMPSRLFDAWCLRNAVQGLGTNEKTVIEILSTRNNAEIKQIKENYQQHYKRDLEEDIKSDTSGHFKRTLVGLLQANRSDEESIDQNMVTEDAKALYKAGEDKVGTDESVFNSLLVRRSKSHLLAVFEAYRELDQQDIEAVINSETSGSYREILLAIVQHIKDPLAYFATCFNESMKGKGTDDERLMMLAVSHCEIDLKDIADTYMKKFGRGLSKDIAGDTSGDYRKLLLKLCDTS